MIALGNIDASKVYLGSQEISKIYLGSTQIWGGSSPTPPTPVLPYDAEVEYLQSTGSEWIDLNLVPKSTYKVEVKFSLLGTNANASVYGCSGGLFLGTDGGGYLYSNNGSTRISPNLTASTNIAYTVVQNGTAVTIDLISYTGASITENGVGMYLFGRGTSGGSVERYTSKIIYYFKIYDGDTLVMDLVPVRVGQTGYMYDRVSGTLFGNAGTGNFVVGADKGMVPYDSQVEYLQSSGTQYIDTGVDYDSSVIVNARLMFLESVAACPFGLYYNDGTARRWQINRGTSNTVYAYINTVTNKSLSNIASNAWHYVREDNRYVGIDTAIVDSGASTFSTSTPVSIYVFARHNVQPNSSIDTPDSRIKMRLSKMRIVKGGVLVRDYIPVRKNGVGYLFDRVSGQLFGNLGTDSFTYGNDVPTTYDSEVEYLRGTGTQYIDSAIECTGGLSIKCKFRVSTNVNNQLAGGILNGTNIFRHHLSPYTSSGSNAFYWLQNGTANVSSIQSSYSTDTWYEVEVDAVNGIYKINSTTGTFTPISSSLTTNAGYGIFARLSSNTATAIRNGNVDIAYFQLLSGGLSGTLLRDYIPVRASTTGYLYDRVSGQLFSNDGTGSFNYGSDVTT